MATNTAQQISRKEPGYRDVRERLVDCHEVEKMLTADEAKLQASRCLSWLCLSVG